MGSFSREFTIRQLTPIIHFQSEEAGAGATVRATELKPKLDRFLCGRYQAAHGESVPKAWQIEGAPGNDGRADYFHLNYKAQVFSRGRTEKIEIGRNNFPMYFGNMGDGKQKHGVLCPDGLTLKITCLIQSKAQREALLDFLSDNLELFFLTHNFGTRQTKGYGGFLCCPEHSLEEQLALLHAVYPRFVYFRLDRLVRPDAAALNGSAEWAEKADLISMAMKTGRNLRLQKDIEDNYVKGFLRTYEKLEGGSDKAMMKGVFQVGRTKEREKPKRVYPKPGQYQFKRALLGLTDNYAFRTTEDKAQKPISGATITVKHTDDPKAQTFINRFPSPVLVKVLPTAVCFLPEDAGPILGKEFAFQSRGRTQVISTPAAFDTEQFLMDFKEWYNDKKYAQNSSGSFEAGSLRDRCSKIQLEVSKRG